MAMAEPFNNATESRLIKQWMPRKRGETYIACESVDFQWSHSDVRTAIKLWDEGNSLWTMQRLLDRPQDDVLALIFSLAREGKINPRKRGIFYG
ncbi:hypothetical protein [Sporolactobacillus laevolacticus]|uniref:Uncharacterized protein n=1 Tax=Sporolactobacillus laevolacticus DSM 442 TaxID=1395513 RepID=V6IVV4_9BACL|nr:hypothetical protein [Sporolactobacillus laevolacticus]EST11275.1 hypothetical protein P343_12770 [Sporolactobacillus laevolacticus DSM 442]